MGEALSIDLEPPLARLEVRNLHRPFEFFNFCTDFAQTMMLNVNISFLQKIANRGPNLSYEAGF